MGKFIDLTGQRFGSWTVLKLARRNIHDQILWLCRCDCGREYEVGACNLRTGDSTKCLDCRKVHGMASSKVYQVWTNMQRRCYNENDTQYENYGGRGITVCDEWMDVTAFNEWCISNGYNDTLTLDRIDNDAGYGPSNCRFATIKQQARNKRTNVRLAMNGREMILKDWSDHLKIPYGTMHSRYRRGCSVESILKQTRLSAHE